MEKIALFKEAFKAGIRYDEEIQRCANDPEKMSSHCTAEGDTLDDLYLDWITKTRAACESLPVEGEGKNDGK